MWWKRISVVQCKYNDGSAIYFMCDIFFSLTLYIFRGKSFCWCIATRVHFIIRNYCSITIRKCHVDNGMQPNGCLCKFKVQFPCQYIRTTTEKNPIQFTLVYDHYTYNHENIKNYWGSSYATMPQASFSFTLLLLSQPQLHTGILNNPEI